MDSQQLLAAQYLYDPFGNTLSMSGPLAGANTHRFSSKEAHAHSGLYYYGYRYYSPNLQRWINEDPIAEEGDINIHRFVFNDPVNWIDSDGLQPVQPASPRPSVRNGPRVGEITEELLNHARRGSGRLTREEEFYARKERELRDKLALVRGQDPNVPCIRAAPPRPAPPNPLQQPQNSLSEQDAPPGIVYLRTNPSTGESYIGRANNESRYVARQRFHNRVLKAQHTYSVLDRFEPGLELRAGEESFIRHYGGPQTQGGPLANRRYEMNEQAFRECGGTTPKPTR